MARATPVDWTRFSYLVAAAIAAGATISQTSVKWDISKGCNKPYEASLVSMPPDDPSVFRQEVRLAGQERFIDLLTPCRKCEVCLRNRRILWQRRMETEIRTSFRSWFITYTVNPHMRFIFAARAKSHDYIDTYREISKELTKMFKRLRKAGHKFRYVLVAEAHKNGYPHVHVLLHEVSKPITKRALEAEWPHGFTSVKLVNDLYPARYVAKYLAKDARTRIRASLHYGQSAHDIFEEVNNLLRE